MAAKRIDMDSCRSESDSDPANIKGWTKAKLSFHL
jgi:hypothetical protein